MKIKLTNTNLTKTSNGAVAYTSTKNTNLDLFGSDVRISHQMEVKPIQNFLELAFKENKELAILNCLYAIDIRGGKQEKAFAELFINFLAINYPSDLIELMPAIVKLSRWDRLFNNVDVFNKETKQALVELINQNHNDGLMWKWLPSINATSQTSRNNAKIIARLLGMDLKTYRQTLSKNRKVLNLIETNLCKKDKDAIIIKNIGKNAFLKYHNALNKLVPEKMEAYFNSLKNKEIKVNVDSLSPVDLYNKINNDKGDVEMWNQLWKEIEVLPHSIFPVVDVSGSMSGQPSAVANSLGILTAQNNKGAFENKLMIFSNDSKVLVLDKDKKLSSAMKIVTDYSDVASTNLNSVFNIFYNFAILSPEATPKAIVLFSDMQFNEGVEGKWDKTIYQNWKNKFKELSKSVGYEIKIPNIIYWNINNVANFPTTKDEKGVILLSGYSAHSLSYLSKVVGDDYNPEIFMNEVLSKYRVYLK